MGARFRGKGDVIPHSGEVLAALGACRKRMLDAATEVRPFGTAYHAVSMVVTAIDALATFITGQRDYFSIGGSAPPAGRPGILPARREE